MADLFPEGYKDETGVIAITRKPIGYRESIFYNDEKGDCEIDGKRKIKTASGIEAWKQWCMNCIDTDRYMYPCYSSDFGIDYDFIRRAYNEGGEALAEAIIRKEISDALIADDYKRTRSVTDFEFDWTVPDAVKVNCTVIGIAQASIDLSVKLGL
ncbi:MAG: DUF2634 domain-containing protein [bacterium]|nr:DUF2634 domain-containing protein [bacterium]